MKPVISLDSRIEQLKWYYETVSGSIDGKISAQHAAEHPQVLRRLFAEAYSEISKENFENIGYRKEIAIFINPPSPYRSPHIELVKYFLKLGSSLGYKPSIYISHMPSLGNVRHTELHELGQYKFDQELSEYIRSEDKSIEINKLVEDYRPKETIRSVVRKYFQVINHGHTSPELSVSLSGGGKNMMGSWGIEWLDGVFMHSRKRCLAMMGMHDEALDENFYTTFLVQPNHKYEKREKSKRMSIVIERKPKKDNEKNYGQAERVLLEKIRRGDKRNYLVLISNWLNKRMKEQDYLNLLVLKAEIRDLKLVIGGKDSDIASEKIQSYSTISYESKTKKSYIFNKGNTYGIKEVIKYKTRAKNIIEEGHRGKDTRFESNEIYTIGWIENLENLLDELKTINDETKNNILYTFCSNSGNGQTNSIAAYSGLTTILQAPNDSRRSLPDIYFCGSNSQYLNACRSILISKTKNREVQEHQQKYLQRFIYDHTLEKEATKIFVE